VYGFDSTRLENTQARVIDSQFYRNINATSKEARIAEGGAIIASLFAREAVAA
jgi:hypothetical protein